MKFSIYKCAGSWWLESPHGNQYEFGSFDTAVMGFDCFDIARFIPKNYGQPKSLSAAGTRQ